MDEFKKKLFAAAAVSILALSLVQMVHSSEGLGGFAGPYLDKFGKSRFGNILLKLPSVGNFMLLQRIAYMAVVYFLVDSVSEDLEANFVRYIVANPDINSPPAANLIRYFLSLLYPLYFLALIITGFYIIFIPGSPLGRLRAKSLFAKLIISMVLVSISPYLMNSLLLLTSQGANEILGDAEAPRGHVRVVVNEFTSMLLSVRNMIYLAVAPNLVYGAMGTLLNLFRAKEISTIGHALHAIEVLEIETVWTVPQLMLMMLIIVGFYGLIALRYFMVLMWGLLLPFTIFFSSFEFTRGLGRTMIEQTLLWSLMQVFYSVIIVVFALGIIVVPQGMYSSYGIGYNEYLLESQPLNNWYTIMRGLYSVFPAGEPFFVSIFTLGGLFMLFVGPILLLTFFQKLLPP